MSTSELTLLIGRARAGSQDALGELLGQYANYLRLIASLQLDRSMQAKCSPSDMVQATFVQAHKGIAAFAGQSEGQLLAWLRKILASQITMEYRRYATQRRDVKLERHLDRSSALMGNMLVAQTDSPSKKAAHREEAVLLADALSTMPENYRGIIIARHLQGRRFDEIAAERGQTVDSVKAIWRRAIARLREQLHAG